MQRPRVTTFTRHQCPTKGEGEMAKVLGPSEGKAGMISGIGVRFMIDGAETNERFSLVEHPMPPRSLAAPLHRHLREDEYTFVVEGQVGCLLGDDVLVGN